MRNHDGNKQHCMKSVSNEPADFKYTRQPIETLYLNKNREIELSQNI